MKFSVLLVVIGLLCASCNKNRIFEKFEPINEKGWYQDSIVSFTFTIDDETQNYDLSVDVRNKSTYKYCNLYFRYFLYNAKGEKLKSEMPEVFLMDSKTGKPLGSGIGGLYTNNFGILKNYKFPAKGVYKVNLKQYMRDVLLEEIKDIGLKVEKSNPK